MLLVSACGRAWAAASPTLPVFRQAKILFVAQCCEKH
jgi:hypothetical protein